MSDHGADAFPDSTSGDGPEIDVFLVYNEKESGIEAIVAELERNGLDTHFFRRDFVAGGRFGQIEAQALRRARTVVVLIGAAGWSTTQLRAVEVARSLGKPLLPVLIGSPPADALDAADGLFRDHKYEDLREMSGAGFARIAAAVERPKRITDQRFDQIISTLVDGSDAERATLLRHLASGGLPDASALAERLRTLIQNAFAPDQETRYATAIRDPTVIPRTRSWMLSTLILLDADHPRSQAIVLAHLNPRFEGDRSVRFWCLAGLAERKPAYLPEALARARDDTAPEVVDLAAVIADPTDEQLHDRLRRDLASDGFETAWHVLRVLRVVPVPQLASEVSAQLERFAESKPLTYDALFALATPEMARAALGQLVERPGVERLVALILDEARQASAIAVRSFSYLLTIFDPARVRRALDALSVDDGSRNAAQRILSYMAEVRGQHAGGELFIAGYASDTIDVEKDDIGIARDVETLAAVILAREVVPPLAIGLFGPWGSGKSFFMRSIQAAADRISLVARTQARQRFCGNIVQINFNAWHYSDANLWASLVSHIFDQLSAHVAPGLTPAEQHAVLQGQLESSKADIAVAEAEQARARLVLRQTQQTLEKLRVERERKEVRLRDLRASDLADLLANDPALDTALRNALHAVGAPAAVDSLTDLHGVVNDSYSIAGRAAALLLALFKSQSRGVVLTCIALLLITPPLIWWLIHQFASGQLAFISTVTAELAVIVGGGVTFLRRALSYVQASLDALSNAKQRVDTQLAKRRALPTAEEQTLEREIARSRDSEQEATTRLAAAQTRAIALEERVAALKESQSLGYFLAERTRSDDYRRHLGLISVIRKDFETLVARLKAPVSNGRPGVDRIILYIDDLDRCPSTMVVDVLQAVHLLLAYPLFVVVVSVDPRWLLRSLEARYRHFDRRERDADAVWETTPQDYLEKIFQIPFSVQPLSDDGFSRLLRRLLAPGMPPDTNAREADQSRRAPGSAPLDAGLPIPTDPTAKVADASGSDAAPLSPELTQADLEIIEEALVIRPVEYEFASRLHGFISTPRAAKRFANIYRILKAPVARSQLERHEGSPEIPGEFQLPMLLLALLIGHPTEAAYLFPQFLKNARQGSATFWMATGREIDDTPVIAEVRRRIATIASAPTFPASPELLIEWLPKVARFSFVTAGVLAASE